MKSTLQTRARLLAFYLPQFYPTPENDEWWGRGFTEWTNVAKARPLFPGHYQPRLPGELGFYDLRVPETRLAQADLAREHGIEGFCYWHYWFEGRRLLDRPFDEVLHSGEPDFPFCLAWANHTWSRSWLGENKNILMAQTYSPEDDKNHARWLVQAFSDQRYITVSRRPLFIIYNPYDLPEANRTLDTIRNECVTSGLPEPFFVGINISRPDIDARTTGCDMTLDHQPRYAALPGSHYDEFSKSRFLHNLGHRVLNGKLKTYDYEAAMNAIVTSRSYPNFPSVAVGWDNTARRGDKALIFTEANPDAFGRLLSSAIERVAPMSDDMRLVFINAWNEWGEGMHLEPDMKHGRAYLEAVRRTVCL